MKDENTDFEQLFAQYYDKLYFDGFAENIKESDPARYNHELNEFKKCAGLPTNEEEELQPLALDKLPIETLCEIGRGRETYRGTEMKYSVFLIRIKGKEYIVSLPGLRDLETFGEIPFAAPYRGESEFINPIKENLTS